jgi:hypothetical protein
MAAFEGASRYPVMEIVAEDKSGETLWRTRNSEIRALKVSR